LAGRHGQAGSPSILAWASTTPHRTVVTDVVDRALIAAAVRWHFWTQPGCAGGGAAPIVELDDTSVVCPINRVVQVQRRAHWSPPSASSCTPAGRPPRASLRSGGRRVRARDRNAPGREAGRPRVDPSGRDESGEGPLVALDRGRLPGRCTRTTIPLGGRRRALRSCALNVTFDKSPVR